MSLLLASVAAFSAGLAASAHCLAMCGAISHGLARASPPQARFVLARQGGRVAAYTLAGAVVGGIGEVLLATAGSGAVRLALQALFALSWLWLALRLLRPGLHLPWAARLGTALWRRLQPWTRPLLPASTPSRAFLLGGLWGFMPCGLSYAMLMVAASEGSALGGAAIMAAFGVATSVALSVLDLGGQRLAFARPGRALRYVGAALAIMLAVGSLYLPLRHRDHVHDHALAAALQGADYCLK
jgi:hypothetical protein